MALINPTPQAIVSDAFALAELLIPSSASDIIGVYNQETFAQVFIKARPMKVSFKQDSRTMEHPIENGSIVGDHIIILQIEIILSLLIQANGYSEVYNEIRNLFDDSTLLYVQTKTGVYGNMFIQALPHEEVPEIYDSVVINLNLKEVFIVSSNSIYAPADAQNTNTVANGQVSPQTVTVPVDQHGATGAW